MRSSGNDPTPQFGDLGFIDAILPFCAAMVIGMTGFLLLPISQLQARESGALGRLRATPLSPWTYVAADLNVNSVITLVGVILALLVGSLGFGATMSGSAVSVLGAVVLGMTAFLPLGYGTGRALPRFQGGQRDRQRPVHHVGPDLRSLHPHR